MKIILQQLTMTIKSSFYALSRSAEIFRLINRLWEFRWEYYALVNDVKASVEREWKHVED